jgi:hypothetical protein
MAIIINEIEVMVEVTPHTAGPSPSQSPAGNKEDIVRECVEKVMEILNQKNER